MSFRSRAAGAALLLLTLSFPLAAQTPVAATASPAKRPLSMEDLLSWRGIRNATFSNDGQWMAYVLAPNEGDAEFVVRATRAGATETRLAIGEPPAGAGGAGGVAISGNNRWVAYTVHPKAEDARKARRDRRTLPTKVGVIELATGARREFDRVRSFRFAGDRSNIIALQLMPPDAPAGGAAAAGAPAAPGGSVLMLVDLAGGTPVTMVGVGEYAFDAAGQFLAFTLDQRDQLGNGVQLRELATGVVRALDAEKAARELAAGESARANAIMVGIKLLVLALFVIVGSQHIDTANYTPFAPNGFRGIHQGAAIVFFAYIGFDAISTAAEEVKDPQRTMPRGLLWGLGICTLIYVIVGAVATGLVPYQQLASSDPLAHAFDVAGLQRFEWIISAGAVVSMSAVLLVFQYGQPRIFYAMARDGLLPEGAAKIHKKYRTPHVTTIITGVLVALAALVVDDVATYDLTNIGTLFAFVLVCGGVLMLRIKDPDRPRPFRVPFVWVVAPVGLLACLFVMVGLPMNAWKGFGIWLAIGLVLYAVYGWKHSRLRRGLPPHDFGAE